MDYYLLTKIAEELSLSLAGARLERVFQGTDRDIYFLFRKDRKAFILLLSPQRSLPRIHLVSRKPQSVSDPHPFVLYLRSRLVGARLIHIGLLNEDRIIVMLFERNSDNFRLILELTGSSSNLFFTDNKHNILASYYSVTPSEQGARMLLSGRRYVPPQKKMRDNSPKLELEIDASSSLNEWAEQHYLNFIQQRKSATIRSELRSHILKATKKAERKRDALIADLEALGQAEEYRHKGELILSHLQKLKQGIEDAVLTGYDGIAVLIPMDPRRTPTKNAELYFKKYKKAKTGMPLITERLGETEERISWLRAMSIQVENAADIDSLNLLRSALVERSPTEKGRGTRKQASSAALNGIRVFIFQGWEILVGRNANGNDRLTTRLARADDLWLHAEGQPGSHVLIRNPRKTEIPLDILVKAASLAAFYSKGRSASKVSVTYAEARFVRKPKGAKPGLVTLSRRKTIMVEPAGDAQG
ncbi:MAG TPA: NFACT family protein [Nitrospirota bacterium]|nr:NFACT family protein [Nitrospirota bacterium]